MPNRWFDPSGLSPSRGRGSLSSLKPVNTWALHATSPPHPHPRWSPPAPRLSSPVAPQSSPKLICKDIRKAFVQHRKRGSLPILDKSFVCHYWDCQMREVHSFRPETPILWGCHGTMRGRLALPARPPPLAMLDTGEKGASAPEPGPRAPPQAPVIPAHSSRGTGSLAYG